MLHRIKEIKKHSFRGFIRIFDEKYGVGKLERLIASNWFNPFTTLWINFRSFKFSQAIRFPIWCYGKPRIYGLSGSMIVEGKLHTGMIRMNKVLTGAPSHMGDQTEIINNGLIIFKGKLHIGTGCKIAVGRDAKFQIGADSKIADKCNIGCFEEIIIGDKVRVAHRCQIFDSNYHFIAYLNQAVIPNYKRPVTIGKGCWICNSSTISCGVILQNNTIVASCSLVNKDFSQLSEGSIIGGVPAKFITNARRIYSEKMERELAEFYSKNPSATYKITRDIEFE